MPPLAKPLPATTLLWLVMNLAAAAPLAPTALQVAPLGTDRHVLRWTDQSADETGFTIERQNGAAWDLVANVLPNTSSYIDEGRPPGALPTYRVSAYNGEGPSAPAGPVTSVRMNVLFFFADDMGYKDIVANRNAATDGPTIYETPALDTLSAQGVNFTQAYCSGPKCVVARRAIQTGMYDYRDAAIAKNGGIGAEMVTIGEALKAAGYRTGFIGKWHLGGKLAGSTSGGDEDFSSGGVTPHQPLVYTNWSTLPDTDPKYIPASDPNSDEANKVPGTQGYDVAIATGEWGAPPISYFANAATGTPGEFWYGLPDLYTTNSAEYLTDRLTDEATGFMGNAVTNHPTQPFFLMLAHYAVHTPLEAKASDIAYFEAKKSSMAAAFASHPAGSAQSVEFTSKVRNFQDQTTYAAMMKSFDESLASIRSYLATTADPRNPGKTLAETTIIVLSSDHGGKSTHWVNSLDQTDIPTSNYPLRQGKTWVYEGGLRIPLIVHWPGITTPGASSSALVHGADFYTTFLDMTGSPRVPSQHLDSVSFAESAADPSHEARTESPHWFTNADPGTGNPALGAYRFGDYKLVYHMIRRTPELYNLAEDVGERNDIASLRPDLVGEYLSRLIAIRDGVNARQPLPTSNSWSKELEVIAPVITPPAAVPNGTPSGLTATAVSDTAIDLQWTDGSTDEERFVIQRKLSGSGAFLEIATVGANTTRFRDTGLTPGTTYQYRIQAENLRGWAGPSNTGTATASGAAPLPIIARGDDITTLHDEVRTFQPLANDQGRNLTLTAITQPARGSATIVGNTIRFAPAPGVSGPDGMNYTATDSGGATATGTVRLTVLADHTVAPELTYDLSPVATDFDVWDFNDTNGTRLDAAAKTTGASVFTSAATPTVQSSALRFAAGAATGSIFRNATIASGARTVGATNSGVVQMSFRITGADLSGGANNSSNIAYVGIGTRGKDATNGTTDPLQMRLQENSTTGNLELQARGASSSVCRTFTGLALTQALEVRVVMDLAARTGTVYSKLGAETEQTHGTYAFQTNTMPVLWDTYRLAALNNTTAWGPADYVAVDWLKFADVTYPAPPTDFRRWMDAAQGSTNAAPDKAPGADPDGDGPWNLAEFGFGGHPYSATSGVSQNVARDPATPAGGAVLTLPVLPAASFAPTGTGPLTATAGGIRYTVRGTTDLQSFTNGVTEVFPAVESGLPPVPRGWQYRSFRLSPLPAGGRGFLQATVSDAP